MKEVGLHVPHGAVRNNQDSGSTLNLISVLIIMQS